MIEKVKRNGIAVEVTEKKVGSIYKDEWTGDKVRFHDHRKETREILHMKSLEEKLHENDWFIEETPSDSYEVVIEETVNHLCSDCEQDAMYDTEQGEFYCPRCHE